MSAILGRIEYGDRPVDMPRFERAFSMLAHYGGDGEALASGPGYAFGLQYFRVRPGQTKPPQLERDGTILTADGVIDAQADLLAKLATEPASDFELIRQAFLKWGEGSPAHLFGDYAFAAYTPETGQLFLARDHIGKRPLYWTFQNDSFTFSTDIPALLAFNDAEADIDPKILLRHMRQDNRPQAKPLIKDVNFVDPGCYMRVGPTGCTQTRWWDPHRIKTTYRGSADACVRDLREILDQVIADHVDTDLALGAHVSGGIDSGAVTALAAKALQQQDRALVSAYAWAPAVSEDFPDLGEHDERRNIEKICAKSNVSARFGSTDYRTLEAFHKRPFEREGFANLSEEFGVLEQASQDGVRMILSGWGGDEAFSAIGSDYFTYCLKRLRLVEAFHILRTLSNKRRNPRVLLRNFYRYGLIPLLPDWLVRYVLPQSAADDQPTSFIKPSFWESDPDLTAWCNEDLPRRDNPKTRLVRLQLYGHLAARADTWANWSARYGIQYRYPLLDRRIMEFILTVPNKFHFVDKEPRYLARESTKELLPANLMKYDTVNEQLRWKLRFDYWKALAEAERSGDFQGESAWIDMPRFREAIRQYSDTPSQEDMKVYRRLSLSIRVWYLEQRYRSAGKLS